LASARKGANQLKDSMHRSRQALASSGFIIEPSVPLPGGRGAVVGGAVAGQNIISAVTNPARIARITATFRTRHKVLFRPAHVIPSGASPASLRSLLGAVAAGLRTTCSSLPARASSMN